jgi:rRNA maturation endonuclease Nob1
MARARDFMALSVREEGIMTYLSAQSREHSVICQRCYKIRTWNPSGVCSGCRNKEIASDLADRESDTAPGELMTKQLDSGEIAEIKN